jgi:hypothetical protein
VCVDIGEKEIIASAVSDNDAVDSSTHSTEITENIMVQTLGDVVRPASMFDTDAQGIVDDPYFRCAANRLCRSVGDQTSQMCICIDCNIPAHLFCAEYLMEQNPVEDLYHITVKDLTKEGVKRLKKTPVGEKQNIMFCIFCQAKVKAVKVLAQAMKVAEKESKRKSAGNRSAAKKKPKCMKAPVAIIRELRCLDAF